MTKQTEALALVNKVDQEQPAPVREDWGPGPHEYHSLPESGPERPAIPTVITCPFCSSEHIPGWLHDYNMDRGAYGEQPAIKQDLTPEQPAMFDPSVGTQVSKECKLKEKTSD